MLKISLTLLTTCLLLILVACNNSGKIDKPDLPAVKITTAKMGEVKIELLGYETATINWADGTPPETKQIESQALTTFTHSYKNAVDRTITITGNKITCLYCAGNQTSSLDVSGCPQLYGLYCPDNLLTNLDLTECTSLMWLQCSINQLTSLDVSGLAKLTRFWCILNPNLVMINCQGSAVNELALDECPNLAELHFENIWLQAPALNKLFSSLPSVFGTIYIDNNPGVYSCDRNLAEEKGWTVYPLDRPSVPVTGITLNKNVLSLPVGASEALIADILPSNATNKAASWSSSNPSVATVSNSGVVTSHTAGNATISITTKDGNHAASCEVTAAVKQLVDGKWYAFQTHTVGSGIDLVFLGDGYTVGEGGKYEMFMHEAIDGFFDIQPFRTYREYFNVYVIEVVSAESGIGDGSPKDTKFKTFYTNASESVGSMRTDFHKCFEYAQMTPIYHIDSTVIVLITNSERSSGTTYDYWNTGRNVAICTASYNLKALVQHEAGGHGFGRLADEYYTSGTTISENYREHIASQHGDGWYLNVDITNDHQKVVWKDFLGKPKYGMVGCFEGAFYCEKGVWRPEESSIMNNMSISNFNAPSRALIVKRIKNLVGEPFTMEWFMETDVIEPTVSTKIASDIHSFKPLLLL